MEKERPDRRVLLFGRHRRRAKRAQPDARPAGSAAALATSFDAVYRQNANTGRYEYLSPVIEQLTGFAPDEIAGIAWEDLLDRVHPDDRAAVASAFAGPPGDERRIVEYRFRHKDGRFRWIADHADTVTDLAGHPTFRIGFFRDVSERRLDGGDPACPSLAAFGRQRLKCLAAVAAGILLVAVISSILPAPGLVSGLGSAARDRVAQENAALRAANADLHKRLMEVGKERDALYAKAAAYETRLGRFLIATRTDRRIPLASVQPGQPLHIISAAASQPAAGEGRMLEAAVPVTAAGTGTPLAAAPVGSWYAAAPTSAASDPPNAR